jgi:hypothetical protein
LTTDVLLHGGHGEKGTPAEAARIRHDAIMRGEASFALADIQRNVADPGSGNLCLLQGGSSIRNIDLDRAVAPS